MIVHAVGYEAHKAKIVARCDIAVTAACLARDADYALNPRRCAGCGAVIPRNKPNKYCSHSCSAKHVNGSRPARSIESRNKTSASVKETFANMPPKEYAVKRNRKPKHGRPPKRPVLSPPPSARIIGGPFTRLYSRKCAHCKGVFVARYKTKYCGLHADLYKNRNRNRYAFYFSMSAHPDLFGNYADQLRRYGLWSYSNTAGLTRDHRVSVTEAIKHGYDPHYIRHPVNCELMGWTENNRKKGKSSMKYAELVTQVDAYEFAKLARTVGSAPTSPVLTAPRFTG